jgi:hypothetical protein
MLFYVVNLRETINALNCGNSVSGSRTSRVNEFEIEHITEGAFARATKCREICRAATRKMAQPQSQLNSKFRARKEAKRAKSETASLYNSAAAAQPRDVGHHRPCCFFPFQICSKTLSNKYKLKYHMSVHSDKRSFSCSECEAKFKGRENLVKHVVALHGKRKQDVLESLRSRFTIFNSIFFYSRVTRIYK